MKKDIILAGVGGQGILTIATVIGQAAISSKMNLKQAETHGMSQRGGDVQSHLRISTDKIHSDLIPMGGADLIISVEPMEALRYLPYLHEDGWLITNSTTFENIPNYPEAEEIYKEIKAVKNHVIIDADQIAKDLGSPRSMNIVVLGASMKNLGLTLQQIEESIRAIFGRMGDAVVDANIKALRAGFEAAK